MRMTQKLQQLQWKSWKCWCLAPVAQTPKVARAGMLFFTACAPLLTYKIKILNFHFLFLPFVFMSTGRRRAGATVEVVAGAEREIGTVIEIMTETGGDGSVPGRALEIGIATERETETEKESRARGEKSPPGGPSARPAPGRTRTETLTAGKTNTWTGLRLRSLLLVTSTTARSPASCSLDALFNWKGWGRCPSQQKILYSNCLTGTVP